MQARLNVAKVALSAELHVTLQAMVKEVASPHCVVPENIHTPTTEDTLIYTPPTPQDFPFQGGLL